MNDFNFTDDELAALREFLKEATKHAYASGDKPIDNPERQGFEEYVYADGDFSYRDSYTGYTRSRGMELIRYKNIPVWSVLYGGGMVEGEEALADETFDFLKNAFLQKEEGFESFRGPYLFEKGDWRYIYKQEGDMREFSGYEEIFLRNKLVFFHRAIGGIIK